MRIIPFSLAVIIAVIIFYMSSLSHPYNPAPEFSFSSIIYHFGIFFLLSFFLLFSKNSDKEYTFFVIIFCIFYAGLDEYHQLFVENRTTDIQDFFVDISGVFVSYLAFLFSNKFIKIKSLVKI